MRDRPIRRFFSALITAWCLSANAAAAAPQAVAPAPIEYTISLPAPQTQMVDIAVVVANVAAETLDFQLPIWRPGRYVVLDLASAVREVRAFSQAGAALDVQKTDKSTWRVTTRGARDVRLTYRIYANALGERTRHVDDTHAFLDGAAVFMYVAQFRQNPVLVHVQAPPEWKIACGLDALPNDPNTFAAPNYDVLVDSPFEIGIHEILEFEAIGKPHQIVLWGKSEYDGEKLKKDFAKIVETEAAIFGSAPYNRYVFIVHVGAGANGGTEHLNSTVMQVSRAALEDSNSYERFMGLVAHEMFHTWNVKSFRPAGIHPYDYQRENYTKLLWVAEGTTSYYDDLALVRIDLKKPDDYFDRLAEQIDGQRNRPGELVQSVEDASFDSWIQFDKPTADSVNCSVNFYGKGSLVSLLLDLTIRTRTANAHSLDDVMRTLYERFPLSGAGYTPDDLQAIVEEISGSNFKDFFANHVRGAQPLNFEEVFGVVGMELYFKPTPPESERDEDKPKQEDKDNDEKDKEPATQPEAAIVQAAYIGMHLNDQAGRAVVGNVLSDGPAYAAGILPGDEILAIEGRKLAAADLKDRLKKLKPGQTIQLSLFRRDELRTISMLLSGKPDGEWKIRRVKEPSDAQKAAYESWLGTKWPA